MKCENFEYLINKYIDSDITDSERKELDMHLEECKNCKELFDEMILINEMLGDSEMEELPENFNQELDYKLRSIDEKKNTNNKNIDSKNNSIIYLKEFINKNKRSILAVAAVLVIGVFTYNGLNNMDYKLYSSQNQTAQYKTGENFTEMAMAPEAADADMVMEEPSTTTFSEKLGKTVNNDSTVESNVAGANFSGEVEAITTTSDDVKTNSLINSNSINERKIIKNGSISLEVENFDYAIDNIYKFVNNNNGYIESFNSYDNGVYISSKDRELKSGNITVRIPKEQFDVFFNAVGDFGIVKKKNIYTSDITSQYRDFSSEVANLEVREKKLREIMDMATDIKDVLEVERELSRVRGEINNYKGTLIKWDELVSLSSININIVEVETLNKEVNPIDKTLWQKSKEGLITNINKLIILGQVLIITFVSNIPTILISLVLLLVIYTFVKKRKKKNNEN